jgi:two-component system cell cycle response regulator
VLDQSLLDRTDDLRHGAVTTRPMRVLVVSDQELWIRSLDSTLGGYGFSVLSVSTGQEAMDRVGVTRPDLLIIQSVLRDTSGFDLCASLRASRIIDASTPVVIITSAPCNRESRVLALRAGAWECYSFPLDPELLVLKLRLYASAKLNAAQAREESLVDAVTGLYSTIGTMRRARELAVHARRYGRGLACAVLAPSSRGAAGLPTAELSTAIVQRIAQLLRSVGRTSDVIGRLSQTEFVVFAPDTDGDGIEALARRLIQEVESVDKDGRAHACPVRLQAGCYGVANLAETAVDPVDMVVRATLALSASRDDRGPERLPLPTLSDSAEIS